MHQVMVICLQKLDLEQLAKTTDHPDIISYVDHGHKTFHRMQAIK